MPGELHPRDAAPTQGSDAYVMANHVAEVDPAVDARWASLVTNRRSDVFHSPAWMRVLHQTYNFDIRARIVPMDGTPSAGFVFGSIDDVLGQRIISLPFSDYCDPLVDDSDQWTSLASDLLELPVPLIMKILFDGVAENDARLVESRRVTWHRADTSPEPDAMWRQLASSARRAVRKSKANNVRIRPAETLRDMRMFFQLHLRTRKLKYGLLAQPWTFFEAIWEHFLQLGQGQLMLAEHEHSLLGGVLFLRWKDTLYYKLNASDEAALDLRPNDAALWAGMLHAHASGLRWLDFGISATDQEGLIRYKRKYATEESEVRILCKPSVLVDHRSEAVRDLLPQITSLFVRSDVPDSVTEIAGNVMYRYFA